MMPEPHVEERPVPPSDSESSFVLIGRARSGDPLALDALCDRYLPRLRRWAHGRLPSWARGALDTQDLVQDTLLQVLRRVESFEPRHDGAFQAYLRQALVNRLRDEVRRAQRRPAAEALDLENASPDPSPLEMAIGQEALERYEAALARLRPEDREAIIIRVELGCPYAEVAAALGKPSAAAAHMAVSRALIRLAEEMSRVSPRA
ncbi:MAG TPA: sigma-70 family RNA polymerase sigma factor [Vicinamibacterales bacterium]|nr:sigma-70 family RNA polymerase sigma factor [Vicinamibacterales bacterium]